MQSQQEARHWDGACGKAKDLDFSAAGDGSQVSIVVLHCCCNVVRVHDVRYLDFSWV